ncbi:hypothetical protein [Pseudokineococcus sp. 1T1Z-3]|uniref:hypothetical protein n=1 Tax=Pseudokineococcus sp. 1T1Z-3 TaxID=3132745 RepID=UPI0030AF8D0B
MPSPLSYLWRLRFGRWWSVAAIDDEGYTVLVPVPGDLPVFTDLALAVCRQQSGRHRRRTLVVPDRRSPAVAAAVARERPTWPGGSLELLDLPPVDQLVLPRLGDPGRNHGAQLVAGASAASTRRVVLHDADLFMLDPDLHDRMHEAAEASDLDVLGLSPAWDPWYSARGRELAATWEQTARTAWLRAYPPHRHLGHEASVGGERHVVDTTFWAQWHTDPGRVGVDPRSAEDVVHFNYVISTYRRFQRSEGSFHDGSFRLLLVRLFQDLFGRGEAPPGLPPLDRLAAGLDGSSEVTYEPGDASTYRAFRQQISRILAAPWVERERSSEAEALLAPFDDRFAASQHLEVDR